jgi:vacuolar-type H+-ATPase subunit B/Vma2
MSADFLSIHNARETAQMREHDPHRCADDRHLQFPVESQKIPIFFVGGEPQYQLLARIGTQADGDIIIFGDLGLIFDDYCYFRRAFEDADVLPRTVSQR